MDAWGCNDEEAPVGGQGESRPRCATLKTQFLRIPVHREHLFRFNVNTDSADAER